MGTPAFAVPSLRALARTTELVGVVSQPDRPRGRGLASQPSAVSAVAADLGVPLLRPATIRAGDALAVVAEWRPDLLVVAAYGKILPRAWLELPTLAPVNVHASLLPRHRGAAPIAAAIRAGDAETGVSIMLMSEAMDAGDVLLQRRVAIAGTDTTEQLTATLAELGATALTDALQALRTTGLRPAPQDERLVTYAPRLDKEHGRIDWSADAAAIERMVRAFTPWPSAFTTLGGRTVKILAARVADAAGGGTAPGAIAVRDDGLAVATGSGTLIVTTLQVEGKKAMPAATFATGARLDADARFS